MDNFAMFWQEVNAFAQLAKEFLHCGFQRRQFRRATPQARHYVAALAHAK